MLEDYGFLRVHHSHIINLNEITRYIKGEGGYLMMTDGSTVNVSRSRKELLMQKLLPNSIFRFLFISFISSVEPFIIVFFESQSLMEI